MENKWYIGQDIVCVKSGEISGLVKGKIYTIQGLRLSPCHCRDTLIYVGINSDGLFYCTDCAFMTPLDGKYWHDERMFAPIEYNEQAIKELMETERTKI